MHDYLENNVSFEGHEKQCSYLMAHAMEECMHDEDSLDHTRGVGKGQDLIYAAFEFEKCEEYKNHGFIDMHAKVDKEERIDLNVVKEDEAWDVASFDKEEPQMEVNACMDTSIAKATLRIEEALEEKEAKSLHAYDCVHVENLVEEKVNVENDDTLIDLESKRIYELDGLTLQGYQQVVVMMMLYVAM